ncbi:hypothetical protein CFE70_007211 [Pyrenophora teres f. teres 0-1]
MTMAHTALVLPSEADGALPRCLAASSWSLIRLHFPSEPRRASDLAKVITTRRLATLEPAARHATISLIGCRLSAGTDNRDGPESTNEPPTLHSVESHQTR